MAEGKNIEIKIAATGGDQAAAEVRKPAEAVAKTAEEIVKTQQEAVESTEEFYARMAEEDAKYRQGIVDGWNRNGNNPYAAGPSGGGQAAAPTPASTGFGGMLDAESLDAVPAKVEKVTKSLEELRAGAAKAHSEFAGIVDDAGVIDEKASKSILSRKQEIGAAAAAIGVAAAAAARTFSEIDKAIESIDVKKLREVDAAMAQQVETAKGLSKALSDPIGALLKYTTGETVTEAFDALNEQMALNAKNRADAVDRIIARGEVQVDKLEKLTAAINAANAILDAKDKTAALVRDGQDAAAIRNGADPNDVRAERAKYDEGVTIESINRDLVGKYEKLDIQGKQRALEQGRVNTDTVNRDPKSTREEKEAAEAEMKKRQDDLDRAGAEYQKEEQLARQQKEQARILAANTVADAGGDKAEAAKKKAAQEAAQQDRERQSEERRRDSEKQRAEREREKLSGEAGGIARQAEGLLPKGVSDKFRSAVQKTADGLQNGDQGGELMKLLGLMETLAAAVEKKGDKSLARRIDIMEQRIKNLK